jgi:PadR family transcriptional regulator, regulatory protein PadR
MDGLHLDTSQLLKGVLDLAVLAVLAESDSYGYDVVRRLREKGLDEVGDASVYGTLRRLFQAGALTSYVIPSEAGPHRKYYALNDRGRATLEQSARSWTEFTRALNQVLNGRSERNGS